MKTPPVIGVDPGGRRTGIVVRAGDRLAYWSLVTRETPLDWYLGEVVDAVTKAKEHGRNLILTEAAGGSRIVASLGLVLAVEDLNDPTPQMGMTAVRGLVDTAQVIGAIGGHFRITRIPPSGHGSAPLGAYPDELVDDREREGRGRLRHVRAAWDIAGAARAVEALT